jgi:hypothetical protein
LTHGDDKPTPANDADVAFRFVRDFLRKGRMSLLQDAGPQFFKDLLILSVCYSPNDENDRDFETDVNEHRTELSAPFVRRHNYDEDLITLLVELANDGVHEAHSVLCDIAKDKWKRRQMPLPPLEEYIFGRLEQSSPKRRPGASPFKYFSRNDTIAQAVELLVEEFGLRPTRNDATYDVESACSVVSRALADIEIPMTEDAVKDAYYRGRRLYNSV